MLDVPPPIPKEEQIPPAHLSAALDAAGVSQSELGRRLGMTFQSVNRWCNGHTPITRARWLAALSALGLPPTWSPPTKRAKRPH